MEPDFYQYTGDDQTAPWTPGHAGEVMTQFVNALASALPNAQFSLDVSPWVAPNNGSDHGADWFSNFDMSLFTFVSTSGGGTNANTEKIRSSNNMTWAGLRQASGKPILADTGYGANGVSAGEDPNWNVAANINARIATASSRSQYNRRRLGEHHLGASLPARHADEPFLRGRGVRAASRSSSRVSSPPPKIHDGRDTPRRGEQWRERTERSVGSSLVDQPTFKTWWRGRHAPHAFLLRNDRRNADVDGTIGCSAARVPAPGVLEVGGSGKLRRRRAGVHGPLRVSCCSVRTGALRELSLVGRWNRSSCSSARWST
jgi:hypothetical protein